MISVVYARVSTNKTNPYELRRDLEQSVQEMFNEDYKRWNMYLDVHDGEQYNENDWYYQLQVEIALGKVKRVLVPSLYHIHYNHGRIVDFIVHCRKHGVQLYSLKDTFLNNCTPEGLQVCISTLQMVAHRVRNFRSNKISESKRKRKPGNQPLDTITKRRVVDLWNEGRTVKQVQETFTYRKYGKTRRLALSTVYAIIQHYKKHGTVDPVEASNGSKK